jgi:hypothetical protein
MIPDLTNMYSYISLFFGGALDPTWPHVVLIGGSIVGGALVGLGVVLEAPKILSVPVAAVVVGVVIEAACTLLLFGFDEGISGAQQSRIIALDTELAKVRLPRTLSQDAIQRIAEKLRKYERTPFDLSLTPAAEGSFLEDIRRTLDFAHWDHLAYGGFAMSFDELRVQNGLPHAGMVASVVGVRAVYEDPSLKDAAESFAKTLRDEGFDAEPQAISGLATGSSPLKPNVMHIQIGNRV